MSPSCLCCALGMALQDTVTKNDLMCRFPCSHTNKAQKWCTTGDYSTFFCLSIWARMLTLHENFKDFIFDVMAFLSVAYVYEWAETTLLFWFMLSSISWFFLYEGGI